MFSATVIHGNSAYSWNTMPRSDPGAVTSLPSTWMVPAVGAEKPATALSGVDLPQPDGPSRQVNWVVRTGSPIGVSYGLITSTPKFRLIACDDCGSDCIMASMLLPSRAAFQSGYDR